MLAVSADFLFLCRCALASRCSTALSWASVPSTCATASVPAFTELSACELQAVCIVPSFALAGLLSATCVLSMRLQAGSTLSWASVPSTCAMASVPAVSSRRCALCLLLHLQACCPPPVLGLSAFWLLRVRAEWPLTTFLCREPTIEDSRRALWVFDGSPC